MQKKERFSQIESKQENVGLVTFSSKPDLELESELEFFTILADFPKICYIVIIILTSR